MPWRDMNIVFIPQTRHSSVDLNLADFFFFLLKPHHYGPEDIQYAESSLCGVWAENNHPVERTKRHKCHYIVFMLDHISETMRGDKSLCAEELFKACYYDQIMMRIDKFNVQIT